VLCIESKDESVLKLPERISIELRPRTRAAWTRVQALAQNPRIIISLLADRRLSHIIDFLNSKWKLDQFDVSFSCCDVLIITSDKEAAMRLVTFVYLCMCMHNKSKGYGWICI